MAKRFFDQSIDPKKLAKLNKYVLQEDFKARLAELGSLNLSITQQPAPSDIAISDTATSAHSKVEIIGAISRTTLDPKSGCLFCKDVTVGGYDEFKLAFLTLEGIASIVSHAVLETVRGEYFPISYISMYFYTRSDQIVKDSKYVKYSRDPAADSNRDYGEDRSAVIQNHVLENSILFIDGPLIGGNLTSYTLALIAHLHRLNVLPVFIVKNSDSNLLVDSMPSIIGEYNSDLHWSYQFLSSGQRTNFFRYTDAINPKNTKMFAYIKPFHHVSPQRIEVHPDTFSLYGDYMDQVLDLAYYLVLVQGDRSNPQIRPVAIAERYAREIIKTVNTRTLLRNTNLVPSINQERFGG